MLFANRTTRHSIVKGFQPKGEWKCNFRVFQFSTNIGHERVVVAVSIPFVEQIENRDADVNHTGIVRSITWVGLILYDSIIFALTAYKGVKYWRARNGKLFTILVQDGEFFQMNVCVTCRCTDYHNQDVFIICTSSW